MLDNSNSSPVPTSLYAKARAASAIQAAPEIKVYRRRWFMLLIFVLVSFSNCYLWIQYSIINNIIMKFYGKDSQTINWLATVFMVAYIPLILPGAWIMDKVGLRWTVWIAAFGTAIAAWINVFACKPDNFYVAMIAQTIAAISQVFVLSVPPYLAGVWFGPDEVSFACSIGVFGNQMGVAIGSVVPPLMVKDHPDREDIGRELKLLHYLVASFCTVLCILVIYGFQDRPPLPPSVAQSKSMQISSDYIQSVKRMMTNIPYVLLLLSNGIIAGVSYSLSTFLNQTVLAHYPGQNVNAGFVGLTIILSGLVGTLVFGKILDATHKFRETKLAIYWLSLASLLAYTFTFTVGYISVTFITAGVTGFFTMGYLPVGYEYAAELTHPEPEATSCGLLNLSTSIFALILIVIGGKLLEEQGDLVCNVTLSAALFLGAILAFFIRSDLKRLRANQQKDIDGGSIPSLPIFPPSNKTESDGSITSVDE